MYGETSNIRTEMVQTYKIRTGHGSQKEGFELKILKTSPKWKSEPTSSYLLWDNLSWVLLENGLFLLAKPLNAPRLSWNRYFYICDSVKMVETLNML